MSYGSEKVLQRFPKSSPKVKTHHHELPFYCAERPLHPKLEAGQVAYTQHQYAEAFQLLSLLAYQGYVTAQCLLGSMFQLGLGVERDSATAKRWYQQAGLQGCALSFHNLATIYEVDEQNPALAQYYRQQAKEMGCDLVE